MLWLTASALESWVEHNCQCRWTSQKTLNSLNFACNRTVLLDCKSVAVCTFGQSDHFGDLFHASACFRLISVGFISWTPSEQYTVCMTACLSYCTLFTVTVPPVHSASEVPEKAPGSDPAVRIATVIVFSYSFSRVALSEAGHFGPVHAPGAGLCDVYRSAVEPGFAAALGAVSERQDEWRGAAETEPTVRSQQCGCESKNDRDHVRCVLDSPKQEQFTSAEEVFSQAHRPAVGRVWEEGREKRCRSMKLQMGRQTPEENSITY